MEFGALANAEALSSIDWALPPITESTQSYLQKSGDSQSLEVLFGAPAWGHREWISKIYPVGAKPAEFLRYYAEAFSCVELNSSHYAIPSSQQTTKWLGQVPADFIFCPKVAQTISHSAAGLRDVSLLREWFRFVGELGSHLGTCFIQFPPQFSYADKQSLFLFLQSWPAEIPLALEFRHPSWFADGGVLPALADYLQTRAVGLVVTDVAGRRDVLHSSISSSFSFVRFIANNLHPSDYLRSGLWAARLRELQVLGLKRVYFMVHEPDDISAPEMARHLAGDFTAGLGHDCVFPRREVSLGVSAAEAAAADEDKQTKFEF